uniref:Uncharacterized protein n=1 Tax=Glycine max TaxID=3847 RepID=C6T523_SOYBN|nr:unknown [Glycine max]
MALPKLSLKINIRSQRMVRRYLSNELKDNGKKWHHQNSTSKSIYILNSWGSLVLIINLSVIFPLGVSTLLSLKPSSPRSCFAIKFSSMRHCRYFFENSLHFSDWCTAVFRQLRYSIFSRSHKCM